MHACNTLLAPSFNLWWLYVPLMVIWACYSRIAAHDAPQASGKAKKQL
jgi:hypothetical protein